MCAAALSVNPTTTTYPWWKKLLTGQDNQTWDVGRISWALSFLAVLALAVLHEFRGAHESIKDLGLSLTGIAAGHGIGIGMKGKTEPGGGQ